MNTPNIDFSDLGLTQQDVVDRLADGLVKTAALVDELAKNNIVNGRINDSFNDVNEELLRYLFALDPHRALETIKAIRAARNQDNFVVDLIGDAVAGL